MISLKYGLALKAVFGRALVCAAREFDPARFDLSTAAMKDVQAAADMMLERAGDTEAQGRVVEQLSPGTRLALCRWMIDPTVGEKLVARALSTPPQVRRYADTRTKPVRLVRSEALILVTEGEYSARLMAVAPFFNAHGERMSFSYRITGGPHDGVTLTQSAARSESSTSKLAAVLRNLLGRDPTLEELREGLGPAHIGMACRIIATQGSTRSGSKYSTVETATRI